MAVLKAKKIALSLQMGTSAMDLQKNFSTQKAQKQRRRVAKSYLGCSHSIHGEQC